MKAPTNFRNVKGSYVCQRRPDGTWLNENVFAFCVCRKVMYPISVNLQRNVALRVAQGQIIDYYIIMLNSMQTQQLRHSTVQPASGACLGIVPVRVGVF